MIETGWTMLSPVVEDALSDPEVFPQAAMDTVSAKVAKTARSGRVTLPKSPVSVLEDAFTVSSPIVMVRWPQRPRRHQAPY